MQAYERITVSPIAGALGAGDRRRRHRCRPRRRDDRRNPPRAARAPGDLLPRPDARRCEPQGLHPPLRRHLHPSQLQHRRRRSRDRSRGARARRRADRRRGMAFRHHDDARAADGRHPLCARRAALWRRHPVRQPVPGLRQPLRRHEVDAGRHTCRAQRHPRRGPAGRVQRPPLDQGTRGFELAADRERSSGGAYPSRDRPQVPVREPLLFVPVREHDRPGEQAAARLPDGARPPAGIHLPLPLGNGLDRLLGQSGAPSTWPSTTPARSTAACSARRSRATPSSDRRRVESSRATSSRCSRRPARARRRCRYVLADRHGVVVLAEEGVRRDLGGAKLQLLDDLLALGLVGLVGEGIAQARDLGVARPAEPRLVTGAR